MMQNIAAAEISNDLHVLDPASMSFQNLSSFYILGTAPPARYGHGFKSAEGKLYVHGGWDGNGNWWKGGPETQGGVSVGR
jgi:hypothetical protein